jgi:hypothetical protein
MKPSLILVTLRDGRELTAFTWIGLPEFGIRRAMKEGSSFGYDVVSARALTPANDNQLADY